MFKNFDGPSPKDANWEGWTPPWMSREGEGPRGPFGPGRHWGHWGHHGHRHGPRGPFGFGFRFGGPWGVPDELLALRSEAMEVARLFAIASRGAFENKERVSQLRSFLDRSRKELSDMIYGTPQGSTGGAAESTGGSADVGEA